MLLQGHRRDTEALQKQLTELRDQKPTLDQELQAAKSDLHHANDKASGLETESVGLKKKSSELQCKLDLTNQTLANANETLANARDDCRRDSQVRCQVEMVAYDWLHLDISSPWKKTHKLAVKF